MTPEDRQFGDAIHALLRELGWSHGELTPSLVHQALAQVRHLRKQCARLAVLEPVWEAAKAWAISGRYTDTQRLWDAISAAEQQQKGSK